VKILLNYTLTSYQNEHDRKTSIIKPILLPPKTDYSSSYYSFQELKPIDNASFSSGSLNKKYPVPLEPINRSISNSHQTINNSSSYIDNSYLQDLDSPIIQSPYKTKGEDILKTRKICVSLNNNNNIMDIIDGQSNNLSVNSMNQKQKKRNYLIQNRPKLASLPKSYHHLLF
jgi:hypothetical protein